MRRLRAFLCALALLVPLLPLSPALSVEPDEVLADPALEARARALSARLRCLVCQNQSIDESDADLAKDLRLLVRERLQKGETDEAVIDFLVARYGEFILLRPTFSAKNLLLWLSAPLMLLFGLFVVYRTFFRTRAPAFAETLAGDEEAALAALLQETRKDSTDAPPTPPKT